MPYSIVKLDQDLRLAILEKVGVYSVRFSYIQVSHTRCLESSREVLFLDARSARTTIPIPGVWLIHTVQ